MLIKIWMTAHKDPQTGPQSRLQLLVGIVVFFFKQIANANPYQVSLHNDLSAIV